MTTAAQVLLVDDHPLVVTGLHLGLRACGVHAVHVDATNRAALDEHLVAAEPGLEVSLPARGCRAGPARHVT